MGHLGQLSDCQLLTVCADWRSLQLPSLSWHVNNWLIGFNTTSLNYIGFFWAHSLSCCLLIECIFSLELRTAPRLWYVGCACSAVRASILSCPSKWLPLRYISIDARCMCINTAMVMGTIERTPCSLSRLLTIIFHAIPFPLTMYQCLCIIIIIIIIIFLSSLSKCKIQSFRQVCQLCHFVTFFISGTCFCRIYFFRNLQLIRDILWLLLTLFIHALSHIYIM